MIHEETVNSETLQLIKKMSQDKTLQDFVLAGGTALALQLGHRRSVDIDLRSQKSFDAQLIAKHLESSYKAKIRPAPRNEVCGMMGDVKIGIISHKQQMIKPLITSDEVRMASLDDIGAMKMHAIVNDGRQVKDFVDMYYLLEHCSLDDLTQAYTVRYPGNNSTMARYGLLYHDQVKIETNLELLLRPFNWEEIAERLFTAVAKPKKIFEGCRQVKGDFMQKVKFG